MAIVILIPAAQAQPTSRALSAQFERHVKAMQKDRQVLRFFAQHPWLLTDSRFATEARRQLAQHRRSFVRATRRIARLEAALQARRSARRLAALAKAPARRAICIVFGKRLCAQALAVARCESRLRTSAENGQYRGLFQMSSTARRLFGHGATAFAQARAAHRYFVHAGRNWGPWSCKPR